MSFHNIGNCFAKMANMLSWDLPFHSFFISPSLGIPPTFPFLVGLSHPWAILPNIRTSDTQSPNGVYCSPTPCSQATLACSSLQLEVVLWQDLRDLGRRRNSSSCGMHSRWSPPELREWYGLGGSAGGSGISGGRTPVGAEWLRQGGGFIDSRTSGSDRL